jgi:hypothetical protein
MNGDDNRPGYKCKRNRDGTVREYWAAAPRLAKRGYTPKAVRLHYDLTTQGRRQLAARCQILQAEMLAWSANEGKIPARGYDGSIGSLVRRYQTDELSPFNKRLKWNSQENVAKSLKVIERTIAARNIGSLIGTDFHRWHQNWGAPKDETNAPRPWRAKHAMDVIRQVIAYGVTLGLDDCIRADTILSKLRFPSPPPRTQKLTFDHVQAIRTAAHKMGLGSVALATVLQFELSLRQKDVVGEWEPAPLAQGGILHRGTRWTNGLMWSDIDAHNVLRKTTTKRSVDVEHDLNLSSVVLEEIALVPPSRRIGPMIVSERTGVPYKHRKFTETWRRVAEVAGVPHSIWNMDARSGAISELYDAGASTVDAMKHAGHQDVRMSARYNRGSLEQTRRAARQRQEKRLKNKDQGRGGDV